MLFERVFFIIERISDILNIDNERNQILTFCQELSPSERMVFLELHLDFMKTEILESSSDDEIRGILELYSDNEKKGILKWYLFDPMDEFCKKCLRRSDSGYAIFKMEELCEEYDRQKMQKLNSEVGKRKEFIYLYLPGYRTWELKNVYGVLSHDDKQEFRRKYIDCWRYKILKYLEFRQRWFHKHSAETLFEIISLLMQGKEVVVLSKDVKVEIVELQKRLWWIYNYVRDVEAKYDDRQMMSEYETQLYHNLSYIAHSSDDILDHITSNDVAHQIHTLLETIHNFYTYNLSSTGTTYLIPNMKFVVKNNINIGGHQSLANMNFFINRSIPLKDKQNSRPKSYGHVPNTDLVGFNHEIQILFNHLVQSDDDTKVVGIVGPGGSGKTTLAKHIYHHHQINTHFTHKAWVCVSQSWDKSSLLNLMWRQVAQNPNGITMEYDQVVCELSKLLCSKSYLVVVDDIWSIDAWYDISPAFSNCSGSKVVLTTRKKFLPLHIDPKVLIVEPKGLNDKECYELFKKRALLDENVHHELKSLGMKMVKKCKGLPLAVVALAGVLGIDKRKSSWERISERVTDKMLNMANKSTQGVVKEILALSYYELDGNLKRCALYLRLFPEDYIIEAQQLIQMWRAECFMDEEYKAEEYLDEMAQRSIVEVVETNHMGQVLKIRIHDLIREMLINMDKERGMIKNQQLRVTIYGDGQEDFDSHLKVLDRDLYENSHARSFIFLKVGGQFELEPLFIRVKLLRVLIISRIVWRLPEEIGNLIHLRYLELNGDTKHLPVSIGNLENLLTLHLGSLYIGEDIRTINLEKLKELRHLYMPWTRQLLKGVEKLKKLKTFLCKVERMLSVMSKLSRVLQELSIVIIREEKEFEMVFRTPSITSNNLHTLVLRWNCKVGNMSMMSKCKSITKLVLDGRIKKGTPLMFPPNLIYLEMTKTEVKEKQVMNIISNSCPLLKFLVFKFYAFWGTELICNKNSFPQLEKLVLELLDVKMWIIERGAMPILNHLVIKDCPLLEVNEEGWERISIIPQLSFQRKSLEEVSNATIFEQKLRMLKSCTSSFTAINVILSFGC